MSQFQHHILRRERSVVQRDFAMLSVSLNVNVFVTGAFSWSAGRTRSRAVIGAALIVIVTYSTA